MTRHGKDYNVRPVDAHTPLAEKIQFSKGKQRQGHLSTFSIILNFSPPPSPLQTPEQVKECSHPALKSYVQKRREKYSLKLLIPLDNLFQFQDLEVFSSSNKCCLHLMQYTVSTWQERKIKTTPKTSVLLQYCRKI